ETDRMAVTYGEASIGSHARRARPGGAVNGTSHRFAGRSGGLTAARALMRDARGSGRSGWGWARWVLAGLWLIWPGAVLAQEQEVAGADQPAALTLEEAIRIARQRNPTYLAQSNDEGAAAWGVREAWSQLVLPQASASLALGYQASGTPRFGIFTGSDLGLSETPVYYSSSYTLGLSYRLSGATLLRPAQARALRRAAEARGDLADFELVSAVTRQYLAVLRAQDGVALARQELARAEENWRLARA